LEFAVQAARRRRDFDFAVDRFAVVLRRALPERFAAVFSFALRTGLAFFYAILAMFSLSLFCPVDVCPKNESQLL
jgi:hypothetical protein